MTAAAAAAAPVLTIYSKPACVQCDATYRPVVRAGLEEGIEYVVIDITKDDQSAEFVRGLGHLQAPVVVFGDRHWSGFRPDEVRAAIAEILEARENVAA